jgi:hypothetical protein
MPTEPVTAAEEPAAEEPMLDWADQQLAALRPRYPQWDICVVRIYTPKHTVWCARPAGTSMAMINADSPESLIVEIRQQEDRARLGRMTPRCR